MSENENVKLAQRLDMRVSKNKSHVYWAKCGDIFVNFDTTDGRVYAKGASGWLNNDEVRTANSECAAWWDAFTTARDKPAGEQTYPTKSAQIQHFSDSDTEQIINAVERGAVLQDFFYTIRINTKHGPREIVGLSYAGAMQAKHNWDAEHPDNQICFGETQIDELNEKILGDDWICLKVPAWRQQTPDARVTGRFAQRKSSFGPGQVQFAVTAVEHKAMRNAIEMLSEPATILQAQRQYIELKRKFVSAGLLKSAENIAYREMPPETELATESDPVYEEPEHRLPDNFMISAAAEYLKNHGLSSEDLDDAIEAYTTTTGESLKRAYYMLAKRAGMEFNDDA